MKKAFHVWVMVGWLMLAGTVFSQGKNTRKEDVPEKVALIIAVNDYENFPKLNNAVRDGELMHKTLLEIGWKPENIMFYKNMKRGDIPKIKAVVQERINKKTEVFVYIAGHGVSHANTNWLVAVDAKITKKAQLEFNALSLQELVRLLDTTGAEIKFVAVDACRTPLSASLFDSEDGARSAGVAMERGLSRSGTDARTFPTLIIYATNKGAASLDGHPGGNSPFARILAENIKNPDVAALMMAQEVLRQVSESTNQSPDLEGWLRKEFYFSTKMQNSESRIPVVRLADNSALRRTWVEESSYSDVYSGEMLLDEVLSKSSIFEQLRKAKNGDVEAKYLLGVAYLEGRHVEKNLALARSYFNESSQGGFNRGTYAYANMLYEGMGGDKNILEALRLWKKGVADEFPASAISLGRHYAFHAPPAELDFGKAQDYFQRAINAKSKESVWALEGQAYLARMGLQRLIKTASIEAWLHTMKVQAEKGSPTALSDWGDFHRYGMHGVVVDLSKAYDFYVRGVRRGCTACKYKAGELVVNNPSINGNIELAVKYLTEMAAVYPVEVDSLLVKAYVMFPRLMPTAWPLDKKALESARAGSMDGLHTLVMALRDGHYGWSKDLGRAAQLAEKGYRISTESPKGSNNNWPLYAKTFANTIVRGDTAGVLKVLVGQRDKLVEDWGDPTDTSKMKKYVVGADCAGVGKVPFELYVWDTKGKVGSVRRQFDWLESARGCRGTDAYYYDSLYNASIAGRISFVSLVDEVIPSDVDPVSQGSSDFREQYKNSNEKNSSIGVRLATREDFDAYLRERGLYDVLGQIADFEREKKSKGIYLDVMPIEGIEDAFERIISGKIFKGVKPVKALDNCSGFNIVGVSDGSSGKSLRKASVLKLDFFCSGKFNAGLIVYFDDSTQPVLQMVRADPLSEKGIKAVETKYFINTVLGGVMFSFHDFDWNGVRDAIAVHEKWSPKPTVYRNFN